MFTRTGSKGQAVVKSTRFQCIVELSYTWIALVSQVRRSMAQSSFSYWFLHSSQAATASHVRLVFTKESRYLLTSLISHEQKKMLNVLHSSHLGPAKSLWN